MSHSVFDHKSIISLINEIDLEPNLSEKGRVKLPRENVGPSGQKFRSLISELVSQLPQNNTYLEIGVFKGRTILTSAKENPTVSHIGVDDFSQFDPDGINKSVINSAVEQLELSNINLIESDFKDYLLDRAKHPKQDVGVFFYDAIHDYRSQLMALYNAPNFLSPGGVILVDDTNYAHVRYATYDFISAFRDFKLLFETYTHKHPSLMTPEERDAAQSGWWNGTQVIIHDPDDLIIGLDPVRDDDTESRFSKTVTLTPTICPDMEQRISSAR